MGTPIRLPFRHPAIEQLAIPAVSILVIFLAYSSQYLFYYIEPGPLNGKQFLWFNGFVLGIWSCYGKACTADPGPRGWVRTVTLGQRDNDTGGIEIDGLSLGAGMRWCTKCAAPKPARAHHCRQCHRCIPKMDHHCPWTTNCVSYLTFPHFIRFVFYAVTSMSILTYHILQRVLIIWENRNLPAYLGPPVWALVHIIILLVVNTVTLFALTILLAHAVYGLGTNTTMIESWEIERHEALVDRSRRMGGYIYTNWGQRMPLERQEFPYDVGIWKNLCQGMGTKNMLMWLLPFGGAPKIESAANWEVNGFGDEGKLWPPPDPERMQRPARNHFVRYNLKNYGHTEGETFSRTQRKDNDESLQDEMQLNYTNYVEHSNGKYEDGMDEDDGWTNSDGDRLRDFGVDEADMLVDDDVPLGELHRLGKLMSRKTQ